MGTLAAASGRDDVYHTRRVLLTGPPGEECSVVSGRSTTTTSELARMAS